MKKYYWVWLYQVKDDLVNLKNGEFSLKIKTFPNAYMTKLIENQDYFQNTQIIMVERILPYHVKEVRTGLIIPILNIDNKPSYRPSSNYKIKYSFGKVHTFVFSENNKIIGRPVESIKELEWYVQEHPYSKQYKQELKAKRKQKKK